jgi:hypothetical protein
MMDSSLVEVRVAYEGTSVSWDRGVYRDGSADGMSIRDAQALTHVKEALSEALECVNTQLLALDNFPIVVEEGGRQ